GDEVRPRQRAGGARPRGDIPARGGDQEVRRDEDDRADDAQQDHAGDDALGTLLGALVQVGLAVDVRGQARVREPAALLRRDGGDAAGSRAAVVVVAHARIHFAFAPSHTAVPRSRDRMMVHAYRPSVTGPSEPSEMPPGEPVFSSSSRYVMTSRLSSGDRLVSLKTGMFCGPVSMAS